MRSRLTEIMLNKTLISSILCCTLSSPVVAQILQDSTRTYREKVAVLSFSLNNIQSEEGALMTQQFVSALDKTRKFDIMNQEEMNSILQEAKVKNLETCDYSLCLADIGKILGVQKIIHGSAARRGKLYTVEIRIIGVVDANLLYDKKIEYSGETTDLLNSRIPELAREIGESRIEAGTPWYIITVAAVLFVSTVYLIYKSFRDNAGGDSSGGGSTTPQ